MAVLNTILPFLGAISDSIAEPSGMWQWFILKVFAFVADYGWRIVVFTVLLKLVLSPLDFYQRYKMHKNQKITERLKPTMEKLQKQYGADNQAFSQKQMELNRKEGYSYFSSCLPMILTMVIFITLWTGMRSIAGYMTLKQYTSMYDAYESAKTQVEKSEEILTDELRAKAMSVGQEIVYQMYFYGLTETIDAEHKRVDEHMKSIEEIRVEYELSDEFAIEPCEKVQVGFLWVKNVWAPDVPWGNRAILDYSAFESTVGNYKKLSTNKLKEEDYGKIFNENNYNDVMAKLIDDKSHSHTNGYLVLPILVLLLSVASQIISMFQQKKAGQVNNKGGAATSMKVMMFIMPLVMAFFALQYASIFTLYMTVNSASTLLFNFTFTGLIELADKRKRTRRHNIKTGSPRGGYLTAPNSPIIHYVKGANPHAGEREQKPEVQEISATEPTTKADKRAKKSKSQQSAAVKRGGRPDPRELMDIPSPQDKKKK